MYKQLKKKSVIENNLGPKRSEQINGQAPCLMEKRDKLSRFALLLQIRRVTLFVALLVTSANIFKQLLLMRRKFFVVVQLTLY